MSNGTELHWLYLIIHSIVSAVEVTSDTCHLVDKATTVGSSYNLMNLQQVGHPTLLLVRDTIATFFVKCMVQTQWRGMRQYKHNSRQ
jgi:hypothetical protein